MTFTLALHYYANFRKVPLVSSYALSLSLSLSLFSPFFLIVETGVSLSARINTVLNPPLDARLRGVSFRFPRPHVSCQIIVNDCCFPLFVFLVMVKGQSSCVRLGPRQIALMTLNGQTLNRETTPRSIGASVMRRSR